MTSDRIHLGVISILAGSLVQVLALSPGQCLAYRHHRFVWPSFCCRSSALLCPIPVPGHVAEGSAIEAPGSESPNPCEPGHAVPLVTHPTVSPRTT